MPNYKAWIYTINISIIALEICLVLLAVQTIAHPLWTFVPVNFGDPNVIIYLSLMILQTFTCICGLSGIFYNKLVLLKIYWIFTIPLLIVDLAMIFPFVEQIAWVNKGFTQTFSQISQRQIQSGTACPFWDYVQSTLYCCAPTDIQTFCSGFNSTTAYNAIDCTEDNSCQVKLLKWMHGRLDAVSILIYYILLPLKFIVVIVLREDIQRIFSRNEFSKYDWDTDDDEEYFDKDYSPYIKRTVIEQVALTDPLTLVKGPNSATSQKKCKSPVP